MNYLKVLVKSTFNQFENSIDRILCTFVLFEFKMTIEVPYSFLKEWSLGMSLQTNKKVHYFETNFNKLTKTIKSKYIDEATLHIKLHSKFSNIAKKCF